MNSPKPSARPDAVPATPEEALGRVAHAYSNFATENPALYDAMFTRATRLRFGAEDTPVPVVGGVRRTA